MIKEVRLNSDIIKSLTCLLHAILRALYYGRNNLTTDYLNLINIYHYEWIYK